MGLILPPVVKMARRVVEKHSLHIPFDIRALVAEYAEVIYKAIPIEGVDGICLNLKTPGKRPKVIINHASSPARINFTLAHELGHIIIPWHYGTIVDEIEEKPGFFNSPYWEAEREANRFASELLMPFSWILSQYEKNRSSDYLVYQICRNCNVSEIAAKIRLGHAFLEIESLLMPEGLIHEIFEASKSLAITQIKLVETTRFSPKRVAELMAQSFDTEIAYCIEHNNTVISTGGSPTSHYFFQLEGEEFLQSPYTYFKTYSFAEIDGVTTHWWTFDPTFEFPDDSRSWKEILNKIAFELFHGKEKEFKATFNGRVSGAYSIWTKKKKGDIDKFVKDVILRFDNPCFRSLVEHPEFLLLIKKRCEALFKSLKS